jgi:hypothetical protein
MDKPLSKASKKYHIKTGGEECCPFCKTDVDMMSMDWKEPDPVEGGDFEQEVKCLKCNRRWINVYRLVDMRELCGEEPWESCGDNE